MPEVVVTQTLAEAGEQGEEQDERLTAQHFQPIGTQTAYPAAYSALATYPKESLVVESGVVYRSVVAGNKANTPSTDDGSNWVVQPIAFAPLVNPNYGATPTVKGT